VDANAIVLNNCIRIIQAIITFKYLYLLHAITTRIYVIIVIIKYYYYSLFVYEVMNILGIFLSLYYIIF
jgi:hypothetical protein